MDKLIQRVLRHGSSVNKSASGSFVPAGATSGMPQLAIRAHTTREATLPVVAVQVDVLDACAFRARRYHHAIAGVDAYVGNPFGRCRPHEKHEVSRRQATHLADPLSGSVVLQARLVGQVKAELLVHVHGQT